MLKTDVRTVCSSVYGMQLHNAKGSVWHICFLAGAQAWEWYPSSHLTHSKKAEEHVSQNVKLIRNILHISLLDLSNVFRFHHVQLNRESITPASSSILLWLNSSRPSLSLAWGWLGWGWKGVLWPDCGLSLSLYLVWIVLCFWSLTAKKMVCQFVFTIKSQITFRSVWFVFDSSNVPDRHLVFVENFCFIVIALLRKCWFWDDLH